MQLRYFGTRIFSCLWFAVTALAVMHSVPGFAQTAMTTSPVSAMGMTSPLASAGPEGVPMDSVEINPGGLSPTFPGMTANSRCSGSAMSGISAFDGGGISGMQSSTSTASGMMNSCNPTPSMAAPYGMQAAQRIGAGPSTSAVRIPLDATQINSRGVSPMTSIPAPATLPSALSYSQSTGMTGTGCRTPGMPGC